jgi:rhodanese-related sulfurtransferase
MDVRMIGMKRQIKDAIYEQLARSTKALCHPKRIEILDILSQGEKTVETLAEQAELGIKNASAQLKELKSALLVDSRKDGKHVYYRLRDQQTQALLLYLRKYSEHQFSELQKIASEAFASIDEMESLNRKQLFSKAKRGEVILLDVRPFDEFQHAHLPFALSVPLSELSQQMKTLPKDKEIIAYCRGPYCFFAKEAVDVLRRKGFRAQRLKDSISDWESQGLPVIRGKGA